MAQSSEKTEKTGLVPHLARCVIGGILMGLANLVPGISGGTMLLAAGVYPYFVEGVAEVTTFRFRVRTIITLGAIAGSAALAILLLAGTVKGLVVDHRWIMYSLFIGLTLGGVPVVWRLLRPLNASAVVGCVAGLIVMVVMALAQPGAAGPDDGRAYGLLLTAGVAGASAMILPGVSGGYLLLILGQYIPILSAIDTAKTGAQAKDWAQVMEAMHVFIPVGVGVVIGVVGVSNLMKLLLAKYRKPTLGVLMGLLLGAVLGLWPFQAGVAPEPGEVIKGRVMTVETIAELEADDFPLQRFNPTAGQIAGALGLILAGFAATVGIAKIGGDEDAD
jgi:putative membrane protein